MKDEKIIGLHSLTYYSNRNYVLYSIYKKKKYTTIIVDDDLDIPSIDYPGVVKNIVISSDYKDVLRINLQEFENIENIYLDGSDLKKDLQ